MLSTVKFCFTTIDPRREKHSMSAQRTTAAAAIIKCLCRKDFASRSFPGSLTRYRSQLMMPFSPETPKSSSSYPNPKTPSETHMAFSPCCHGKTKKTGRLQRRDHTAAAHPDPYLSFSLAAARNNAPGTHFPRKGRLVSPRLFHFFVPV
jgi:hypothetical protein